MKPTMPHRLGRPAFSLIEVMIATVLALSLMAAVATLFGSIGNSVNNSRSTLEMAEQLRAAEALLQRDLANHTAMLVPPQPATNGYFEIIEGPLGRSVAVNSVAWDTDRNLGDTTAIDWDDILMFTTRSTGRPFVGRCQWTSDGTIQSDVAEVAWFVRGRTLYRRVLLVAPGAPIPANTSQNGFYNNNDVSVRIDPVKGYLVANSLGDLAKRQYRFAHNPTTFPHDARGWGVLGLPTLRECSAAGWPAGSIPSGNLARSASKVDLWRQPPDANGPNSWGTNAFEQQNGALSNFDGPRVAEDVVLTNVIGFDVKVFDPGIRDYVDLGHANGTTVFSHFGDPKSGLNGSATTPVVYDTGCTSYETEGLLGVASNPGVGSNGIDDNGDGIVDDAAESVTAPPYPAPLRGIQVKIRCFEPDSRTIREVTVVQDFLPK